MENNIMTVHEAMSLKMEMEKKISRIINEFQTKTMIEVESINVEHIFHETNNKPYISLIKIKVTL